MKRLRGRQELSHPARVTAVVRLLRRLLGSSAVAMLAIVSLLWTAAPASAADYDSSSCYGHGFCTSDHKITASRANRLIVWINTSTGDRFNWTVRDNSGGVWASGSAYYSYYRILTNISYGDRTYSLTISSASRNIILGYMCNFTTYPNGAAGPCVP
jgi:hypothetical protein